MQYAIGGGREGHCQHLRVVLEQWELSNTQCTCSVTCQQHGSLDSHRFVMLIFPSPSEIIKRQVLSHTHKNYNWGWMDVTGVYCSCTTGKTLKRKLKKSKKKGFYHFPSDLFMKWVHFGGQESKGCRTRERRNMS